MHLFDTIGGVRTAVSFGGSRVLHRELELQSPTSSLRTTSKSAFDRANIKTNEKRTTIEKKSAANWKQ